MRKAWAFSLILLGTACGTENQKDAELSVINGKEVPESSIPWVGWITSSGNDCTGTFISASKMITAAHCIKGSVTYYGLSGAVDAIGSARHPKWVDEGGEKISPQYVPYDLAVVTFPNGTVKTWARLGASPKAADRVSVVGFGSNKWNPDGSTEGGGYLRVGFNNILSVGNSQIIFKGQSLPSDNLGTNASASKGDSGGPLFLDRAPYAAYTALVGVASGAYRANGVIENRYPDLTSASSVDFLRSQGVL